MNDDLQPLKNRLRWLNRGILALGVLILLGLIVWAVVGLRKPEVGTSSTVIHPASSASNLLTRAASAVVASTPRPAMSTAQQERAAAAAIDALSAASAPAAAAASQPAAPSAPSEISKAPEASSPAVVKPVAAPPVAPAVAVKPEPAPEPAPEPKPAPKPQQHKAATQQHKAQPSPRPAAAKPQRVGAVQVCRAAGWYVQVGAFGKQESIDRLAQRLHRAGYTQVCVAAKEVRGLHLFYVGPYRDAAAARAARAPLHKLTGAEGILRKLP